MFNHKFLLLLLGIVGVLDATAQKKHKATIPEAVSHPTGAVWTYTRVREVYYADTVYCDTCKLRDASVNENTLAESIQSLLEKNELKAYATTGTLFAKELSIDEIKNVFASKRDTVKVDDPVTGQQIIKIVTRDFIYESVNKYKVMEEWSFDRETGKTSIRIMAIGPEQDIYDEDGKFRGDKLLFWLKYEDVKGQLAKFEMEHPVCNFELAVWKDFFSEKAGK